MLYLLISSASLLLSTGSFVFLLLFWESESFISLQVPSVGDLSLSFLLDQLTLSFFSIVSVVSTAVLVYTSQYIRWENSSKSFSLVLLSFVGSMFLLSCSADLFTAIIGWDGLGLSSLCLIVFYKNWASLNGGLVTFMTNRVGDLAIIACISLLLLGGEEVALLLVLGALTNSAQIPFSAWLPLAMAAPTPVSSLVHSSTLVTAGVFLLARFSFLLSGGSKTLLFLLSSGTILLASSSVGGEIDLKKIVALSTLLHIALIFLFLSNGEEEVALIHMSMHALFKSLLFMCVGEIIHIHENSQDVRVVRLSSVPSHVLIPFQISIFSMIGLPFLSGFASKEGMLLSTSFEGNGLFFQVFLLGVLATSCYSVRVLATTLSLPSLPLFKSGESGSVLLPLYSVLSCVGSVVITSLHSWSEPSHHTVAILVGSLFVGGSLGFFQSKFLPLFPSFLSGSGGMWKILPFTLFTGNSVRSYSFSVMSTVDSMGLGSKWPENLLGDLMWNWTYLSVGSLSWNNSLSLLLLLSLPSFFLVGALPA